jgi:hypothetical protein
MRDLRWFDGMEDVDMHLGFISGGESNLQGGLAERIRQEVLAEYAEAMKHAGPLRRFWLRRQIACEIRRRVRGKMAQYHSPYNLYGLSRKASADHSPGTPGAPPDEPPVSNPR